MTIPPPEEKDRAVQAMFDSIAHRYDLNNTLLSLGLHHHWKRVAADRTGLNPGETALDLCAGTGDLALHLARRAGTQGHVVAADLNSRMLAFAQEKIRKAGLSERITSVRANAECLPFGERTFHAVTIGFGIRNVTDMKRGFAEIYRVLKPNGRVVCLEFSRPTHAIMRRLYDLYSFYWLPRIGALISGDRTGTYHYLPASIRAFPDQAALAELMTGVGFQEVTYRNLAGGIVAIHVGVK
jgi:demethylmenaquinone methyltransferase/2-methoxy-6-polyprenyl-1,4-benzoquinol methylase